MFFFCTSRLAARLAASSALLYYSYLVYASYMQKLSTGVLQSSMYNLKPL